MKAEIGSLYKLLNEQTDNKNGIRDWAAMQALQTRINTDPAVEALADKYGAGALVAAVLDQVKILGPSDGFGPHVLVRDLEFSVVENASIIELP